MENKNPIFILIGIQTDSSLKTDLLAQTVDMKKLKKIVHGDMLKIRRSHTSVNYESRKFN